MITDILKKLVKNENLNENEVKLVLKDILEGKLLSSQVASFLTALRMKGETIEEVASFVELLKEKAIKLPLPEQYDVLDIVGTGGDGADSFNITTAAAFVIAAGGIKIAKHGNGSFSSKSGSSDVLKALGAKVSLEPEKSVEILDKTGICFMFAPRYNPTLKNAFQVRKEIGIRTVFNLVGPLINPSSAKTQIIGVYDKELVENTARVMMKLGVKSGMVLFGECGLDEASVVGGTYYAKISNDCIQTGIFYPEEAGIKRSGIEDLKGGDANFNGEIIKNIFKNKIEGAKLDVVALNAATAFYIKGFVPDLKTGVELSKTLIKTGRANSKLEEFISLTNKV